jgi:HSP20 family protein
MLSRFNEFRDWPFAGPSAFRSFGAHELVRELNRLFSDADPGTWESRGGFPRVSLDDQGTALVVRAELPGLSEKDLELTATATTLTLKGERKVEAPAGYSTHRSERSTFRFARTFELPAKVDSGNVEARLEHGVLTVKLPKAPEAQPKQINVKAS